MWPKMCIVVASDVTFRQRRVIRSGTSANQAARNSDMLSCPVSSENFDDFFFIYQKTHHATLSDSMYFLTSSTGACTLHTAQARD